MTINRRIDGATGGIRVTLHDQVIRLVDSSFFELALQARVGPLALGDSHDTGCAHIETMHDSLPLRRPRGADPVARGRQASDDRRT